MMLTICGFDTTTAYNGRLALEKAHTFRPEIILLDIGLPDMDGYELASTIRRECGLATSTFIAISARNPETPRASRAGSQVRPLPGQTGRSRRFAPASFQAGTMKRTPHECGTRYSPAVPAEREPGRHSRLHLLDLSEHRCQWSVVRACA